MKFKICNFNKQEDIEEHTWMGNMKWNRNTIMNWLDVIF
jgi:hypothetical protein